MSFLSDISERLLAVVYPLRARNITAKTRRLLIASTWLVSIAFHSPYLYTFELVKVKNGLWMTGQHSFDMLYFYS